MDYSFEFEFGRLSKSLSAGMVRLPETGMGYQIPYQGNDKPDESSPAVVVNGEFIIQIEENLTTPILTNFENLSIDFEEIENNSFLESLRDGSIKTVTNPKYAKTQKSTLGQQLPFVYTTRSGDEFRRLSAFRNDRRILANGELLPGTYGTTIKDLTVVPSGIAAVGRYALPNRIAACYIYQIIPPVGTMVYFGTVTPNYGLCGGGVEVFFPNGCPSNSARLLGTISEI